MICLDNYAYNAVDEQASKTIWVGSIDPHTTEPQLRVAFEHYGPIESVKILPHRNCAFVKYYDLQSSTSVFVYLLLILGLS